MIKKFSIVCVLLTLLITASTAGLTIITPAPGAMGTNVDTLRATYADYWNRATGVSTTNWPNMFDTANRLQAMSAYTDTYGKAYHFYIGCASNNIAVFSVPINCAGYKAATVMVWSVTHMTTEPKVAADQILGTTAAMTASLWGTPYPYDFVKAVGTNSTLAGDNALMQSPIVQLTQDNAWDAVKNSSTQAAGTIVGGATTDVTNPGATTGTALSVATVTPGAMKIFNIEGLSILHVGMAMSTSTEADGEVILRLSK